MKRHLRRVVPALLVAVALGASATLLVASTGGGARDTQPSRDTRSSYEPSAFCGGDDNGFAIGAETARRRSELLTTGSTTVTTPPICYPDAEGSR